ncbi:uncharacterized protein BO97DRAFT_481811 [Aspergillus homomorphus CBS 101889]|uniref:Uncharacterized protein n=1 Tax=Aspergillus homomorphus (strain CBS 101889) TaxID=1450537 RepID=A0A395HK19_ASPHC|nr:hypothetical protein BO97DRAFT_481811 [Aspergillus homomorphus CBS 101889]RAL06604.1 hypothetical protein BO97DRAFT_481811 [Aspergillus homomorphus CBS 101889]
MSDSVDYKALFLRAEEEIKRVDEERKGANEERKKAEEGRRQEKILREQAETRNHQTTFEEFIQHCHDLLSKPLKAGDPTQSTTGRETPRLFSPCIVLEEYGQRSADRPITSEKDLEVYERFAVENHVSDIISALCKIPSAREEFGLGNGVWFDNHARALDESPPDKANPKERPARPDQFCIHRVDEDNEGGSPTDELLPRDRRTRNSSYRRAGKTKV